MRFSYSLVINKPREVVIQHFQNSESLKASQEGFVKKELISGTPYQKGAISKLYYNVNNREMELTETLMVSNLPDTIEAFYHHKNTDNTLKYSFTAINENQTLYEIEGEYTAVRGFLVKLIFLLFPSMFKKQAKKWTDNFKHYIESN